VLGFVWLAFPLQLHRTAGSDVNPCLTLADRPIGDSPPPLSTIEECSRALPDDAELAADLAAAYESAGRTDEAMRAYRQALDADPFFADAHIRLATLLAARGALDEARDHARAAAQIQPNQPRSVALEKQLGLAGEHP